jgi:hypothetical protein
MLQSMGDFQLVRRARCAALHSGGDFLCLHACTCTSAGIFVVIDRIFLRWLPGNACLHKCQRIINAPPCMVMCTWGERLYRSSTRCYVHTICNSNFSPRECCVGCVSNSSCCSMLRSNASASASSRPRLITGPQRASISWKHIESVVRRRPPPKWDITVCKGSVLCDATVTV